MPPAKMRGDGRMAKDPKKTLLRLLSYLKRHWLVLSLVLVCILVSAVASIVGSTALGKLVDEFILPWWKAETPTPTPSSISLPKLPWSLWQACSPASSRAI